MTAVKIQSNNIVLTEVRQLNVVRPITRAILWKKTNENFDQPNIKQNPFFLVAAHNYQECFA